MRRSHGLGGLCNEARRYACWPCSEVQHDGSNADESKLSGGTGDHFGAKALFAANRNASTSAHHQNTELPSATTLDTAPTMEEADANKALMADGHAYQYTN